MTKKLIALDMDGTLLSTTKTISPENKQAIKDAQAAGHIVMICSGRPHVSLTKFLQAEGLDDLPISASNGTISIVDGQIIDQVVMDKTVAKKVFEWLVKHQFAFNLYTAEGVFSHAMFFEWARQDAQGRPDFEDKKAEFARIEAYFKTIITDRFNQWEDLPADLAIFKFFVLTPEFERKKMFEDFASAVTEATFTSSHSDNVEISDARGHKGTGVTAIANYFGIPIGDIVAMGDNFNDVGMLEVAGLAVAMGNAEDGVKAIADVVTLSNDEHGVAHAIRNYVL